MSSGSSKEALSRIEGPLRNKKLTNGQIIIPFRLILQMLQMAQFQV